MIDEAYEKAKEVVRECSTPHGLFASGGKDGYNAIWARDSIITLIGASLEDEFRLDFKKSLITLGVHQGRTGQIPNAVDKYSDRKPHVDFQTIDSTLWYIIGHYYYVKRYKDKTLFRKYKKSIEKAFAWLECQDIGENGLLGQLPTTDWQDAFPHKYGYTINTHALYFKVLKLMKQDTRNLKDLMNNDKETKLWNGDYYLAYRWKNHNKYKETGDWFDSLGNLMAIVFGLADDYRANKILAYIEKKGINRPYPVKVIYPPIRENSKYWRDYFKDCDARHPWHYANAGIWTFIGGFYVLALIKQKKFKKAEHELEKLAKANLNGNFPEWIHPHTKENYGELQAWNAGLFILAVKSFRNKKVLL
jgi:GH15 family glucan-1,4-alpha-glucosidase